MYYFNLLLGCRFLTIVMESLWPDIPEQPEGMESGDVVCVCNLSPTCCNGLVKWSHSQAILFSLGMRLKVKNSLIRVQ